MDYQAMARASAAMGQGAQPAPAGDPMYSAPAHSTVMAQDTRMFTPTHDLGYPTGVRTDTGYGNMLQAGAADTALGALGFFGADHNGFGDWLRSQYRAGVGQNDVNAAHAMYSDYANGITAPDNLQRHMADIGTRTGMGEAVLGTAAGSAANAVTKLPRMGQGLVDMAANGFDAISPNRIGHYDMVSPRYAPEAMGHNLPNGVVHPVTTPPYPMEWMDNPENLRYPSGNGGGYMPSGPMPTTPHLQPYGGTDYSARAFPQVEHPQGISLTQPDNMLKAYGANPGVRTNAAVKNLVDTKGLLAQLDPANAGKVQALLNKKSFMPSAGPRSQMGADGTRAWGTIIDLPADYMDTKSLQAHARSLGVSPDELRAAMARMNGG